MEGGRESVNCQYTKCDVISELFHTCQVFMKTNIGTSHQSI